VEPRRDVSIGAGARPRIRRDATFVGSGMTLGRAAPSVKPPDSPTVAASIGLRGGRPSQAARGAAGERGRVPARNRQQRGSAAAERTVAGRASEGVPGFPGPFDSGLVHGRPPRSRRPRNGRRNEAIRASSPPPSGRRRGEPAGAPAWTAPTAVPGSCVLSPPARGHGRVGRSAAGRRRVCRAILQRTRNVRPLV
jgi:hypothetical protein